MGRARLLIAGMTVLLLVVSGCDWTQFRQGPSHDGRAVKPGIAPSNVATLVNDWSATTGGAIDSSAAVAGGRAFVGSDDGKLYAFDAGNGTALWRATTGGAIDSSPAVAEGKVFVGSDDGKLYAFDAAGVTNCSGTPVPTCTPLWSRATGGPVTSSPTAAGGKVFVGSDDGKVYAFAAADGAPQWSATTGGAVDSSPAVGGNRVIVGSDDGKVYAFDRTNGTPQWSATTGGAVDSSPAYLTTGVVLVGSDDGTLYAFDGAGVTNCSGPPPATCAPVASVTAAAPIDASPAVVDPGKVYVGSDDGTFHVYTTLFKEPALYPVRGHAVAVGDFNGDLKPDLAALDSEAVAVSLNNGDGTFAPAVNYVADFANDIAVGDFNGDTKPDLATSNNSFDPPTVSVLINNGDGTFASPDNYATDNFGIGIGVGDFNGDTKPDLASTNQHPPGGLQILFNDGDGTFTLTGNYSVGPQGASGAPAVGDFNGDTKPDIAVPHFFGASDAISVYINNGDGTFANAVVYATHDNAAGIAVGDWNGDTKPDLAVTNHDSADVTVLMNNGNGTFATGINYAAGTGPRSVAAADLNGDNKLDLAVANDVSKDASLLFNNGDGTFAAPRNLTFGSTFGGWDVAARDLNGDTKPDLALSSTGNGLLVLLHR